ncbi:MAG: acyl-CoA dehydrogenase family protein [Sneathiella sp.]|nr:acyl-CoA dehydrogenase family protein [Sneathiella sp.]
MLDVRGMLKPFAEEATKRSAEFEAQGFVSQDFADRLAETGLYRLCNRVEHGGLDGSAIDYARATEFLAEHDASAAWVLFIGITSALSYVNLPEEEQNRVFDGAPVTTAGVFAPMGRAVQASQNGEEGFLLSGRWQWGSGIRNAGYISAGGFVVNEDGSLQKDEKGRPDQRSFLMNFADVEILDTWHVTGLKGTGSTDFKVDNLFVPARRTFTLSTEGPDDRPVSRFPAFGFLAIGITAVALGIAKAAIEELTNIAKEKTPQGSRKTLALRSTTQITLAKSHARLKAARLLVYSEIEALWQEAVRGADISVEARRDLRLALTHAVQECTEIVRDMYTLAGGSSVYLNCPLQRHFRDVHVAQQHMMVSETTLELTGRLFLNIEVPTEQL